MINLTGRKALILGVGNKRSIAWAITESLHEQGAEIGLTYLPDAKGRYEKSVRQLGEQVHATLIEPCDVASDEEIQNLIAKVKEQWGELDYLIHSLAFAPQTEFESPLSANSREGFLKAQEISAYSLIPLAGGLAPLMQVKGGGSILTMSYVGSVLAAPNYHPMGPAKASLESIVRYLAKELGPDNIRVNAVSPGPIKTLSAVGVKDFTSMLEDAAQGTALKRNVLQREVGDVTAFLCSDNASAITGQTIYVDCGYNVMAN